MEFGDRLIRGEIVKSYKKLILDVKFREGGVVPVFCPELDYMQNLYVPGTEIWVVKNRDQRRRLRYECQIVNSGGGLIMVNPNHVDALFTEAFEKGMIEELRKYTGIDRVDGNFATRNINYELSNDAGEKCYVYLVSIYNKKGPNVVFPTMLNFYEMELLTKCVICAKKAPKRRSCCWRREWTAWRRNFRGRLIRLRRRKFMMRQKTD